MMKLEQGHNSSWYIIPIIIKVIDIQAEWTSNKINNRIRYCFQDLYIECLSE